MKCFNKEGSKTVCNCFILVSPGLLQSMLDSVLPAWLLMFDWSYRTVQMEHHFNFEKLKLCKLKHWNIETLKIETLKFEIWNFLLSKKGQSTAASRRDNTDPDLYIYIWNWNRFAVYWVLEIGQFFKGK